MTRAISSYKAYGMYIDEPITTRAHQVLVLNITQANSDLTMDLAAIAGTFWAEADADATGAAALAALTQIIQKSEARVSWCAPAIQDAKVQLAAGGTLADASEYKITTTSIVPSLLFFTAGAPTAVQLVLVTVLSAQERAVRAGSL
jgi:hypothetical protein